MLISEAAFRAEQRRQLQTKFDANETLYLERELTQLRAKSFEVQFPTPVARTLAPKATDIASSAGTYSYKVYEPVGRGKFINYESNDLPRVDVVAREVLGKVVPVGASYGWNINELREAARLGLQLPEVKLKTARDTIERDIDEVLAFGSLPDEAGLYPDVGLTGFVNNSIVAGLGIIAGGWWLNPSPLDPEVVLADLNKLVAKIANDSQYVWKANALLLPTTLYTYAQQTVFSTLSGDSILTVFRKNNPDITSITPWYRLNAAGVNGAPRAVAYQKDASVLELIIPQEFEVLPPEMKALQFIYSCHARVGGTKIYQPLGMRYMDFATS